MKIKILIALPFILTVGILLGHFMLVLAYTPTTFGHSPSQIGSGSFYDDGGNFYFPTKVGIGQDPGSYKLNVLGNIWTNGIDVVGNALVTGSLAVKSGTNPSVLVVNAASGKIRINTDSGGLPYTIQAESTYNMWEGGNTIFYVHNIMMPSSSLCIDSDTSCTPPAMGYAKALGWITGSSDVAEYVNNDKKLEPGDVVVISSEKNNQITISTQQYDTRVAGVISTNPGVFLGLNENETTNGKVLLAINGIVPTKVTTLNGPIKRGDLLTTSNIPGYAMRATEYKVGTIIGKAMESLENGEGKINVLVNLI